MAPDNHTVAWNLDLSSWEREVDGEPEGKAKRDKLVHSTFGYTLPVKTLLPRSGE